MCTEIYQVSILLSGLVAALRPLSDSSLFVLLYGITSLYFSGVMVRHNIYIYTYIYVVRFFNQARYSLIIYQIELCCVLRIKELKRCTMVSKSTDFLS